MTNEMPDDRAREILRVLVQQYINDGQPVGSRTLAKASSLSLSPATIRNVMSDLEELGFIASPHTSAGRIPTPLGYRFFVDTLVQLKPPARTELSQLSDQLVEETRGGSKDIATAASQALSSLTSLAGVVTVPRSTQVVLRQIEFLPLGDQRVLAILVMNDSEVQNRVLDMGRSFSESELRQAAGFLNENFAGRDLATIRQEVLDLIEQTRADMNQLMIDSISMAHKALDQGQEPGGFVVAGQTELMGAGGLGDMDKLKQLFEAFNQQQDLLKLLDRSIVADGVQIFIGEESGYQLLDDCSVVTAPYSTDDGAVGVLGVIGPTRMAYERVIPIVDITARLMSSALKSGQ